MRFFFTIIFLIISNAFSMNFIGQDIYLDPKDKTSKYIQMCPIGKLNDIKRSSIFVEQKSLVVTPQGYFTDPQYQYILVDKEKPVSMSSHIVPEQLDTTHVILQGAFPKVMFDPPIPQKNTLMDSKIKKVLENPKEFENYFMVFTTSSWAEVKILMNLTSSEKEKINPSVTENEVIEEKKDKVELTDCPIIVQTNKWKVSLLGKKYLDLSGKFEWTPCQFSTLKKNLISAEFELHQKVTLTKRMVPENEIVPNKPIEIPKAIFIHHNEEKKKKEEPKKELQEESKQEEIKEEIKEKPKKEESEIEVKKEEPKLAVKDFWDYDEKIVNLDPTDLKLLVPLANGAQVTVDFHVYLGREYVGERNKFPKWISELEGKRFHRTHDRRGVHVLTDTPHHIRLKEIVIDKSIITVMHSDNKSTSIAPLVTKSKNQVESQERTQELNSVLKPLFEKPKENIEFQENILRELQKHNETNQMILKMLLRIAEALEKEKK